MMPGETHSAAPGAADLSRCQGCASLQQVRRLPGAEDAEGLGGRARRRGAGRKLPCPLPHPPRLRPSVLPGPRFSLLFCCSCFGNGFLCFMQDWNSGFLYGDAVGGGSKRVLEGPLHHLPSLRAPQGLHLGR